MKKPLTNEITYFQLVKVEKKYNGLPTKYFYNISFDNSEELLLLEIDYPIKDSLVGIKVQYKLQENVIIDFELI